MACLATAIMAAPAPLPLPHRDQLAAPRVGGHPAAAKQATVDNGSTAMGRGTERNGGNGDRERGGR
ncbi:hypothetical protein E4U13_004128 [Claviceps humidiphila]|uniref:Uncharacterized protein n=1 Tax=Claviceps humidiphila TaxID=1294629 RepID=A0A9P7Q8S7_9HYPO|nr:hypothetical protein E4U13_004128 [Claviceps humidiphila]